MNIGRCPKLLAITTLSLAKSAMTLSLNSRARLRLRRRLFRQHLRIDAIRRQTAVDKRLDIVNDDISHLLANRHHRTAKMRREHDILHRPQRGRQLGLMLKYVESGARNLLCLERPHQGFLVDDRSARGVDDKG